MVTIKNGIQNIKDFICRDVKDAAYLSGGTWTRCKILDVRQLSNDRIGIYIEFGKNTPSKITGVRIYGRDGLIWAESTDLELAKSRSVQGFLYRFTIHIVQEDEEE